MEFKEYGVYEMGESLANFLLSVDSINTSLGDSGGNGLLVVGVQVDMTKQPAYILRGTDIVMERDKKFNSVNGTTVLKTLKEYSKKETNEVSKKLEDLLGMLTNNKIVVTPFKPQDICNIESDESIRDGKKQETPNKIESLKWCLEPGSSKFRYDVYMCRGGFAVKNNTKINIEDYGIKFKLEGIESSIKNRSNIDRGIIKFNRFGFINPIEIKSKNNRVAVDSVNVYLERGNNGRTKVIGKWVDSDKLVNFSADAKSVERDTAYNHLIKNLDYIYKHRRYIAPYKLTVPNIITLK